MRTRLLHNQRMRRLQAALLNYGGSHIVVIIIPWHLQEPRIEEGLENEETPPTQGISSARESAGPG